MSAVSVNGGLPLDAPVVHEAGAEACTGNIDKIREIIFGSNMRDYETRFARLEEALRKESQDMREAMRQRLETLESFVHKELAALEGRLKNERDERSENHLRLTNDLSTASAGIFTYSA